MHPIFLSLFLDLWAAQAIQVGPLPMKSWKEGLKSCSCFQGKTNAVMKGRIIVLHSCASSRMAFRATIREKKLRVSSKLRGMNWVSNIRVCSPNDFTISKHVFLRKKISVLSSVLFFSLFSICKFFSSVV